MICDLCVTDHVVKITRLFPPVLLNDKNWRQEEWELELMSFSFHCWLGSEFLKPYLDAILLRLFVIILHILNVLCKYSTRWRTVLCGSEEHSTGIGKEGMLVHYFSSASPGLNCCQGFFWGGGRGSICPSLALACLPWINPYNIIPHLPLGKKLKETLVVLLNFSKSGGSYELCRCMYIWCSREAHMSPTLSEVQWYSTLKNWHTWNMQYRNYSETSEQRTLWGRAICPL